MESLDLRSHGLCVSALLPSLNGLTRGDRAKRADGNSHSDCCRALGEISKELACEDEDLEELQRSQREPVEHACCTQADRQTGRQL